MNAEEEKARLFEIISGHMRINGSEYCSTSEFESDIEDAAEEIYKGISTLRAQLAEAKDIVIVLAWLDEILQPDESKEFVSVNILTSTIKKAHAWHSKVKSA